MKNKTILLIAIVVVIGLAAGFILKSGNENKEIQPVVTIPPSDAVVKTQNQVPTEIPATPTTKVYETIVKSKDDIKIVIEYAKQKGSTLTIAKFMNVKYYFRRNGNLVPASYNDVAVGQNVTYNVTGTTDKELIIEQ